MKKNKGILIIVGIAVLAVVGFFVYKRKQPNIVAEKNPDVKMTPSAPLVYGKTKKPLFGKKTIAGKLTKWVKKNPVVGGALETIVSVIPGGSAVLSVGKQVGKSL